MKTKTKNDPLLGLTEAEFERFNRACNAAWQTIGGDILDAALGGESEGRFNSGSIPRRDVIECTLDADYVRMYGERGNDPEWINFYNTRLNPWIREHYATPKFKRLMARVFPFKRYGY